VVLSARPIYGSYGENRVRLKFWVTCGLLGGADKGRNPQYRPK
jgi:hypothetical protein